MSLVRLQKVIADAGVASRRKAEEMIIAGRVLVNDIPITSLGYSVDPEADNVSVDGTPIKKEKKIYILLNKPKGVTSTVSDAHAEKTVVELIPTKERIFPVGRLDKDTTGALLVTNDGQLAHRLTHPKFKVDKKYEAKVNGLLDEISHRKLEKGIILDNKRTSPAKVRLVSKDEDINTYEVQIHEGMKRQIRRMFEAVGFKVLELKRVLFAGLGVSGLKEGDWRYLTSDEVRRLNGK